MLVLDLERRIPRFDWRELRRFCDSSSLGNLAFPRWIGLEWRGHAFGFAKLDDCSIVVGICVIVVVVVVAAAAVDNCYSAEFSRLRYFVSEPDEFACPDSLVLVGSGGKDRDEGDFP